MPAISRCAFGRTCKVFHRVAGEYFQWKYPTKYTTWTLRDGDVCDIEDNVLTDYIKYIQRIEFIHDLTNHIVSNCEALNDLAILSVILTEMDISSIERILNQIEAISIEKCRCDIDGGIYRNFLKHCTNLKNLSIDGALMVDCLPQKYPATLQQLKILDADECVGIDELKTFFTVNPNVRNLDFSGEYILLNQHSLIECGIELTDLTVGINHYDICNVLNELHLRDFYKQLHCSVFLNELHLLKKLSGVATVYLSTAKEQPTKFIPSSTLFSLGIINHMFLSELPELRMNEIFNLCINIERLFIYLSRTFCHSFVVQSI